MIFTHLSNKAKTAAGILYLQLLNTPAAYGLDPRIKEATVKATVQAVESTTGQYMILGGIGFFMLIGAGILLKIMKLKKQLTGG